MKLFRQMVLLVCLDASIIAKAGEPTATARCAENPTAAGELRLLQGTWEGVLVGDKLQKKITLTIAGNSLNFYRDRNFWFEATIVLPAGKDPKQLHATLTGRSPSQPVDVGRIVRGVFKIENETLTLATISDDPEAAPPSFEALGTRYAFRKVEPTGDKGPTRDETQHVPPQTKYTQPPKRETASFRFEKALRNGVRPLNVSGRSADCRPRDPTQR
jgi:uncharacterized protein (TIGR03067 family)